MGKVSLTSGLDRQVGIRAHPTFPHPQLPKNCDFSVKVAQLRHANALQNDLSQTEFKTSHINRICRNRSTQVAQDGGRILFQDEG